MDYAITLTVDLPYDVAVVKVRQVLADQGFGVLTEIDARATMKSKLDVDMEPYVILGACNPQLAHRALEVDRSIGLLLPCNVVVRSDGPQRTIVQALNPQVMVAMPGEPGLEAVAEEAARRINAALAALTAPVTAP